MTTHPIEADLVWPRDAPGIVEGALAPAALEGPNRFQAHVLVDPNDPGLSTTLVEADRARLTIYRYLAKFGAQQVPILPDPSGPEPETLTVTNAVLDVAQLRHRPQFLATARTPAPAEARLQLEGAHCAMQHPGASFGGPFPEDPDASLVRGASTPAYSLRDELVATCTADGVLATSPQRLLVYGLDVVLRQPGADDRLIKTGRFSEEVVAGSTVYHDVVQVLAVEYADGHIEVAWPQRAQVRVSAPAFDLVGRLHTAAGEGRLDWCEFRSEGDVGALTLVGVLRAAGAPERHILLTGQTVNDPPVAGGAEAVLAPPTTPGLVLVAAAAGVGILGLLVRVALPLFARLRPNEMLDHPRRVEILERVHADPGVNTNTLARLLGLPWTNVQHHVEKLRQGGFVAVRRVGGLTSLFPAHTGSLRHADDLAVLRRPTLGRVHELLRARPGAMQAELATELGVTQQRVSQALRQLLSAGLARAEQGLRHRRYFAVDPRVVSQGGFSGGV
jgi:DNA-binding transcriptional ArsR family regulator